MKKGGNVYPVRRGLICSTQPIPSPSLTSAVLNALHTVLPLAMVHMVSQPVMLASVWRGTKLHLKMKNFLASHVMLVVLKVPSVTLHSVKSVGQTNTPLRLLRNAQAVQKIVSPPLVLSVLQPVSAMPGFHPQRLCWDPVSSVHLDHLRALVEMWPAHCVRLAPSWPIMKLMSVIYAPKTSLCRQRELLYVPIAGSIASV